MTSSCVLPRHFQFGSRTRWVSRLNSRYSGIRQFQLLFPQRRLRTLSGLCSSKIDKRLRVNWLDKVAGPH